MYDHDEPETAADIIRKKLADLYNNEPNARQELKEAQNSPHRSKHQQFMYELSNSGKSLAEIQTAWHAYYQGLPDSEKHQVWQEFYREYDKQRSTTKVIDNPPEKLPNHSANPIYQQMPERRRPEPQPIYQPEPESYRRQSVADMRTKLVKTVQRHANTKKTDHLKSLGFGLACGFIAIVIFLFGFFNERFIAPFITPSRSISNAPIIIDAATAPAGKDPIIVIPKINVQIPVIYTVTTNDENAVEKGLENGVVHYANTANPGEKGNGAIFGHSSNNIFNPGHYKFAFTLLRRLEPGDTFTLQKDGKRYVYRVYERKVVPPNDTSVLGPQPGKVATMTLITCDPPGTSINRMIVFGEQISPDPSNNAVSTAKGATPQPAILPSNSPSLWSRFVDWMSR